MDIVKTGYGNEKTYKFTMAFPICCLMEITGMNDWTPKDTVATKTPLWPDVNRALHKETDKCSYLYIVGMYQYLSRNTWTDIELAINQIYCNTHNPKLSHDI